MSRDAVRRESKMIGSSMRIAAPTVGARRTPEGRAGWVDDQVFLSGDLATAGEIRRVRIEQASDYDLVGKLLPAEAGIGTRGRASPKRQVALEGV